MTLSWMRRPLNFVLGISVGIALSLASLPDRALAEGTTKSTRSTKSTKSKKKKKKSKMPDVAETTAAEPETEKNHKIVMGSLGLTPSPLVGFGGSVASLKSSGSGLEATFTYASGKSGTIAAQVTHIGGRYRMGLGKMFYGAGGTGLRMAKGNWLVLNQTADAEYAAGSSLNAVTLDGAIGGQVKFGSIVIGADVLGISFPLFKMGVKKTVPAEEDYDTADADAQQAKFNKLAAGMTLTLMKVGLGIQF